MLRSGVEALQNLSSISCSMELHENETHLKHAPEPLLCRMLNRPFSCDVLQRFGKALVLHFGICCFRHTPCFSYHLHQLWRCLAALPVKKRMLPAVSCRTSSSLLSAVSSAAQTADLSFASLTAGRCWQLAVSCSLQNSRTVGGPWLRRLQVHTVMPDCLERANFHTTMTGLCLCAYAQIQKVVQRRRPLQACRRYGVAGNLPQTQLLAEPGLCVLPDAVHERSMPEITLAVRSRYWRVLLQNICQDTAETSSG